MCCVTPVEVVLNAPIIPLKAFRLGSDKSVRARLHEEMGLEPS